MAKYTILKNTTGTTQYIQREDGASIPVCEGNSDYQQYLAYVAEHGAAPVETIPDPVAPARTLDERLADVEQYLVEQALGGI